MTNKQIQELLNKPSAVLLGSRGLGVGDSKSNYDIAIHISDVPKNLKGYRRGSVQDDFPLLALEYSRLYQKDNVNLIVYTKMNHLLILHRVISDLRTVPKYLLEGKFTRAELFKSALAHHVHIGGERVEIRG